VVLWETNARRPGRLNVVGPANYLRWRERATAFQGMAAFADTRLVLTGGAAPEEVTAQLAIGDVFEVMGVAPLLGRTFTAEEMADSNAAVTVLTHAFWQRRFGGDPSIVGAACPSTASRRRSWG
jgi:putative ABC transport system permease protein